MRIPPEGLHSAILHALSGVSMTAYDVAKRIGASPVNVTVALGDLIAEGLITNANGGSVYGLTAQGTDAARDVLVAAIIADIDPDTAKAELVEDMNLLADPAEAKAQLIRDMEQEAIIAAFMEDERTSALTLNEQLLDWCSQNEAALVAYDDAIIQADPFSRHRPGGPASLVAGLTFADEFHIRTPKRPKRPKRARAMLRPRRSR